jgi:hypothetical protein
VHQFVHDEEGYDRWVQGHPRGLVFARKKLSQYMVHLADCDHIAWFGPRVGTAGKWNYTAPPGKWCFEERGAAATWVAENDYSTVDCRDCAPAFRPQRSQASSVAPGRPEARAGVVRPGSVVEVLDVGEGTATLYALGEAASRRPEARRLSLATPVAQALMGREADEAVEIPLPDDGTYLLKILRVEDPEP